MTLKLSKRKLITLEFELNKRRGTPQRRQRVFSEACNTNSVAGSEGPGCLRWKPYKAVVYPSSSISLSEEERSNQAPLNNLMTVKELTTKYPSIPWKEYFNTSLNSVLVIGDDEIIKIDQFYLFDKRESNVKGLNDEFNKARYKFMIGVAVNFGANKARAKKELREILEFEMQLNSIALTDKERNNQTALNNLMTVKELTKKYPSIPWKEYFNKMLNSVLLIKKTPKRVVANYLCWKAVEDSLAFLPEKLLNLQIDFSNADSDTTESEGKWRECLGMTNNNVLMASVGALYVRKYFTPESKKSAEEIAVDIKQQLKKDLKKVDWMDEKTRAGALDKLESLKMFIGHPDEILDDKIVDEYYKTLEITPHDYIQAQLNLTIFMKNRAFSQLRKRADKSDWPWLIHSYTTRTYSYYDENLNTIENPAGLLQGIFFNKNRPQYLNYAAFGSFLFGKEITKAFDNDGRQFNKNGYHKDWWTPETNTKFRQKSVCIIQQYGNYRLKDSGVKINGNQTKDINIADNEGVKISYLAYQDRVKRHGTEPKLPGLKYSQSQLFWIQAAITQCAKDSPADVKNSTSDNAPVNPMNFPLEFRVTGAFSNRPEFASDFNCPVGSKMNPAKKCSVW
ncbi:neprilysin-2-like [Belonocnema kinseyi]|uniref:neprilysin-2-like n=1 Tax=Belonocnema kinseyi TaxID=2817044 RepID=UPI00143DC012|nr:neprilysin-2-like [Belonocnema kinseyi]